MSAIAAIFSRTPNRVSCEEIVAKQVRIRLAGRIVGTRLAQAEARAARNVANGLQMQVAIDRACAWALCAISTDSEDVT